MPEASSFPFLLVRVRPCVYAWCLFISVLSPPPFNLRQGLSLNLELGQLLASPSDLPVASAGGQEQASTRLSFLQRFWGLEPGPTH